MSDTKEFSKLYVDEQVVRFNAAQVVVIAFGRSAKESFKDVPWDSTKVVCVPLLKSNLHSHAVFVISNRHDSC